MFADIIRTHKERRFTVFLFLTGIDRIDRIFYKINKIQETRR